MELSNIENIMKTSNSEETEMVKPVEKTEETQLEIQKESETVETPSETTPYFSFGNITSEISTKLAYLHGVREDFLNNPDFNYDKEVIQKLERNDNCKIIRCLCILRSNVIRKYKSIRDAIKYEYKSIYQIPELGIAELEYLSSRNIYPFSGKDQVKSFGVLLNKIIVERINNCKNIFPNWINWEYVKSLFVMKNGTDEVKYMDEAKKFYANYAFYPAKQYVYMENPMDIHRLFNNDRTCLKVLYKLYGDDFNDFSKISDVEEDVKHNVYDFLFASEKVIMVVDCENSDPYRLCAALRSLDDDQLSKISKIMLFNDSHTSSVWTDIHAYTKIPVISLMIDRVKDDKSLVDMRLAAETCREHYQNGVDGIIVCSSDSDYWALVESLGTAKFLFMVEHEKCGTDIKRAFSEKGIYYCYLDQFYSGDLLAMKENAVRKDFAKSLQRFSFSFDELLEQAIISARADLTEGEIASIRSRILKVLRIELDNGVASIKINEG